MAITHVVKAGDTLSKIAQIYYGDFRQWNYIAAVNNLANPNLLKVGQRLTIPPKSTLYAVASTIPKNPAASPRQAADALLEEQTVTAVRLPEARAPTDPVIVVTTDASGIETVEVGAKRSSNMVYAVGFLAAIAALALKKRKGKK